MNRRQILILCIFFGLGIIAIIAGVVISMNASVPNGATPTERTQNSPAEQPTLNNSLPAGIPGYDLVLSTVDTSTGEPLEGVSVYFDGGYAGSTSGKGTAMSLNISRVSEGQHSIRATKPGYAEYTEGVDVPATPAVIIALKRLMLVTVRESGSHASKIDIVFIPSGTSYNCAEQRKITPTRYVTDRDAFVSDLNRRVNESLLTLDRITDKKDPIPTDYRDRFNIYYYYDPAQFPDAFSGCAGTVPEKIWDEVPFADMVIILYPTYYTLATGTPCEPNGCVNPGSGRRWMKIPADQNTLFLHESGHAIFGLIDTYCGGTEYWQNDPNPNVWSSRESCMQYARGNGWDPAACRQIGQDNPSVCSKQFWRWDPDPDIMHEGYSGTFGEASTRRITSTFNTIGTWGKTP